jgi:hypothetical protein
MITIAHVEDNQAKTASLVVKSSRTCHSTRWEQIKKAAAGAATKEELSVTSGRGSNDLPFRFILDRH